MNRLLIFRLASSVTAVLCCCNLLVVRAADRPLIQANLRWSKPTNTDLGHPSILKFVTPGKLAIAGPTEDSPESASRKQGSVEILDVRTGTVTQRIPWSAPSSTTNFALIAALPLIAGRFVLQSWNQLTLFSADGKIVATRTLPIESEQADYNPNLTLWDRWRLLCSPNGKDLLAIRYSVSSRENEEHWLSVETLEDLQLRSSSGPDNRMAVVDREHELCRVGVPKKEPIAICTKDDESHPLCPKCYGSDALFLDENHFVVSSWPKGRFFIASMDGQIRDDQKIGGKNDRIAQMSVAPLSDQVAFMLMPPYVRNKAGKISVYIYDVASKKVTLVMQIPEPIQVQRVGGFEIESRTGPQIAFSPDGHSLAVLDDTTLQMYALTP